jgi:hypothetical protein
MNRIFVVPQSGRTVPDPERGDVLPEIGRRVPKTQYWMRRVADADVAIQPVPAKAKELSNAR